MPFEKGQSGNPGGRPKSKPFKEALLMEALAAERGEGCEAKPGSLRWNARKLLEQGEVSSIKELADRLDGRPPQAVIGGEDDDPPIRTDNAHHGTLGLSGTAQFIADALGRREETASQEPGPV